MPELGATEADVPVATRLVPDSRATHYWDATGGLMRGFGGVLELSEDAWDVFLIYGPEARWTEADPPKPRFWMHQLGSRDEPRAAAPYLDPEVFADSANSMLLQR